MKWLLIAVLAGAPTMAAAEVVASSDLGFEIRHVAEIDAPPDKVRAAALEIGRWWSDAHTYSGKASNLSIDASGCFCERLPEGFVRHMTIVYSAPDALRMFGGLGPLQTEGASGHLGLQFESAAAPGRTRLTLSYVVGGYARGGLAARWASPVDQVLGQQVARLKRFAETGRPD
jgi:hypothetical protein